MTGSISTATTIEIDSITYTGMIIKFDDFEVTISTRNATGTLNITAIRSDSTDDTIVLNLTTGIGTATIDGKISTGSL